MLRRLLLLFLLIAVALFAAACSASNRTNLTDNEHDNVNSEHNETEDNTEHEGSEETSTVPNNGAVIRLISPSDGTTFTVADEIKVEIEVENFPLGQDGNRWHLYVDDTEYAMVIDKNTRDVIRGLEPGEYTITVRLANGEHQDLEDGDSATITVTE